MKHIYIKPESIEISINTEGIIAMSIGGTTDKVWTNKKEQESSIWDNETDEETNSFW